MLNLFKKILSTVFILILSMQVLIVMGKTYWTKTLL